MLFPDIHVPFVYALKAECCKQKTIQCVALANWPQISGLQLAYLQNGNCMADFAECHSEG